MKVGYVGVGAMGMAMAGHMIKRGRDEVFAFDLDSEKLAEAEKMGATPVASLAEMGGAAAVFIVMVVSDQQVLEVTTALAATAGRDDIMVVASTVHPGTMTEAAERAAEFTMKVIDAPVVFGLSGAKEGQLVSLCGGAEEDIETVRDALMAYSRKVYRVGPLGAGQMAKTVNNMISWAASLGNFEGLLLAKRYGVDPAKMREILKDCPAQNSTLDRWDTSRFTWHQKDLDIALDLAQESGLSLPFYGQVDQLIKMFSADRVRDLLYNDSVNYLDRTVGLGTLIETKKN